MFYTQTSEYTLIQVNESNPEIWHRETLAELYLIKHLF